jgi:ATP-dependent Clp protease ATP-binding subunit ClpC
LSRIVDLEIAAAGRRSGFERRRLRLTVATDARELLVRLGHHPLYGARPLKRVIESRVIAPLARKLAETPSLRDAWIPVVVAGSDAERTLEGDARRWAVVLEP